MTKFNWSRKSVDALAWRDQWRGPSMCPGVRGSSDKQKDYLQVLLVKSGRRMMTDDELAGLSSAQASRLINDLKNNQK